MQRKISVFVLLQAGLIHVLISGAQSATAGGLDAHLRALVAQSDTVVARGAPSGPGAWNSPFMRINHENAVQVYIYADAITPGFQNELTRHGVEIELIDHAHGIIQAWAPVDRLETLAGLAPVARVTVPHYAILRTGSVTTEGDTVLNADQVRAMGVNGEGGRVGVISDGVDNLAEAQASGDLPASVGVFEPGMTPTPCDRRIFPTCNEGTAMLEIVHDLAPGATLGFCGVNSSAEFVTCIDTLENEFRADVIVDDLGFLTEPFFEDGLVADTVADAAARLTYVAAAGNDGETFYEADYTPSMNLDTTGIGPGKIYQSEHAFNPSLSGNDTDQSFTLQARESVTVFLQWNERFGSAGSDYDLFLLNAARNTAAPLAESTLVQNGNDNPQEALSYTNNSGSPQTVHVVILKSNSAGATNHRLKMFTRIDFDTNGGTPRATPQYVDATGSIYGHPAAPGAIAVGAVFWQTPNVIEVFSSQGPVTILGEPPRPKPDLVATDGVSVSGAGGFSSRFFGTSAAAPHVAGVIALVRSGFCCDVVQAIEESAVDLLPAGRDNIYGYGRVDALSASARLNPRPQTVIDQPEGNRSIEPGGTVGFAGTCTPVGPAAPASFAWNFGGSGIAASSEEDPGARAFNNQGVFTVTFNCTDDNGANDASPATRTITVSSGGGGGGGCAIASSTKFDPVLPALLTIALFVLMRRRRTHQC